MRKTYPLDNLCTNPCHEAFDILGPHRRNNQRRAGFLWGEQCGAFMETFP